MESLYTKYRPKTFQEVVGQHHVVATLERAVTEGQVSHAYLFCGPRGTGKTTMARLLAKALLCQAGPGHLPDGTCEDCQMVARGEHPDVVEIDAASNTGVDNVRDVIIGRVNYAPVRGAYKVYIVDEVHMLTVQAFNALLKTLEEPPANVVFVLCTTDPQKIPATILSRVQRFDFRAISPEDIAAHLRDVCAREGATIDDDALDLVVRQARGGMRDALTALEQLITMTGGAVTLGAARDLFGETSDAMLASCAQALARRDVAALYEQVATLVDAGRDLLQFVRELAAHLRDVYVVSALGTTEGIVDATGEQLVRLGAEAQAFGSADRVSRALVILGDASSEMRTAPNQRLVLEIAFTRIARPGSDLTLESLAERVAAIEARLAQGAGAVPMGAPAAPVPAVAPAAVPAVAQAAPAQAAPSPVAPAPAPVAPPPPRPTTRSVPPAAPARPRPSAEDPGALQRRWRDVVDGLSARLPSRGSLLQSATAQSDDGSVLRVTLPAGSNFAIRLLARPDVRAEVNAEVARVFGRRDVEFSELGAAEAASAAPTQPAPAPQASPVSQAAAQPAPQTRDVPGQPHAPAAGAAQTAPAPRAPLPWEAAPATSPQAPAPQGVPAQAPARPDRDARPPRQVPAVRQAVGVPASPAPAAAPASRATQAAPVAASQAAPSAPAPQAAPADRATPSAADVPARPARRTSRASDAPKDLKDVLALLEETFGPSISYTVESAPDARVADSAATTAAGGTPTAASATSAADTAADGTAPDEAPYDDAPEDDVPYDYVPYEADEDAADD